MANREKLFAWIDAELDRLGCIEIQLALVGPDGQAIFTWRAESLTCRAGEARRALSPLPLHAGDQEAWEALGAINAALR